MSKTLNLIVQYNVLPLVIALFGGGIILIIAFSYHPGQAITKQYERIRGELQEKKKIGIFDYDQIQKKLISNGFAFRHPSLADPLVYTGVKICMGAAAAALTAQFHPAVAFLGFVLGYASLDLLANIQNNSDNNKITSDLQIIYDALSVQIKGGVYIINALCEDYALVNKSKRLKVALMEMSGEMMMTSDAKKVITNFQNKFSNCYIDSLCVTIIQALDSGEAVELLGDISEQLKSFQNAALMRKKQELDRALTFSSIMEFGAIMFFVIVISLGSLSIGSLF